AVCREEHVPVLIHVDEVTQPQGHSTSGSHERYKSKERLDWEADFDCIKKMREWILENEYATTDQLEKIEAEAKETVKKARAAAWDAFMAGIKADHEKCQDLLNHLVSESQSEHASKLAEIAEELHKTVTPIRADSVRAARKAL